MKHIISIDDFTCQQIYDEILPGAQEWIDFVKSRGNPQLIRPRDVRKIWNELITICPKVQILFDEESTRTAESFRRSAQLLKFEVESVIGKSGNSMSKNESLLNTARNLADYMLDVMVIRTSIEGGVRFVAEMFEKERMAGFDNRNVSVINGGDGKNQHPTQAFLDLLTINNKLGRLDSFTIGFLGDLKYARTVHSLLKALSMRQGIEVVLVSPKETEIQSFFKTLPFVRVIESDSVDALVDHKCDIIYSSRMQKARHTGMDEVLYKRMLADFRISKNIVEALPAKSFIMDPQPLDSKDQQISAKVRIHPKVILNEQAWYGLPMRVYLLFQSILNRNEIELINEGQGSIQVVKEMSVEKYWQEREKKQKSERYFNPIQNGVVIDHIPVDIVYQLRRMLKPSNMENGQGVIFVCEDVCRETSILKKGIILIDGDFPNPEVMKSILSLDEKITLNIIQNNQFRKLKIENKAPITKIGKCPNANCITNIDPEASYKFHAINARMKCHYCEQYFRPDEVLSG